MFIEWYLELQKSTEVKTVLSLVCACQYLKFHLTVHIDKWNFIKNTATISICENTLSIL